MSKLPPLSPFQMKAQSAAEWFTARSKFTRVYCPDGSPDRLFVVCFDFGFLEASFLESLGVSWLVFPQDPYCLSVHLSPLE